MPFSFFCLSKGYYPISWLCVWAFAAEKRRFSVLGLTSNMLVNKPSHFLGLGFLTGVDVIGTLGLLWVNPSGGDSIAESRISLRFC